MLPNRIEEEVSNAVQNNYIPPDDTDEVGEMLQELLVDDAAKRHPTVIVLPPSVPAPFVPPRLTTRDKKVNQSHGYEQANAYKLAHEARKRAAAATAAADAREA